jgi:hypothetical protein
MASRSKVILQFEKRLLDQSIGRIGHKDGARIDRWIRPANPQIGELVEYCRDHHNVIQV